MKKYLLLLIPFFLILFTNCSSNKTEKKTEVKIFASQNKTQLNLIDSNYVQKERINQTRNNENAFSIVLIPDQQSYVDYRFQTDSKTKYPVDQRYIYYRQMNYVKNNSYSNGGDFVFAIFLGDFVAHEMYHKKEWKWSDEATSIIIGQIPYGFIPGNHDYDTATSLDFGKTIHIMGSRMYNKYFGPKTKYFKNMDWFGGATKNGMNQWSVFSFKGQKILFIGLEMEPSDKILQWAQNVINKNKDIPTIIATHSYIAYYHEDNNSSQSAYITYTYRNYSENNTPEQVWEKFIKYNNQIFMIVCGHAFSGDYAEGLRVDQNIAGNDVYTILSDYQGRNHYLEWTNTEHNLTEIGECGDGWIRILDFDLDNKNIHVTTYNPEFEMYEIDDSSDYYLPITWEWGKRYNDNF